MKLGFIGTGTITTAVVTGLYSTDEYKKQILISPRNWSRANILKKKFSGISIAKDNQEIVNNCDLIILAVRPQVAQQVLRPLEFKVNQKILSFIATLPAKDLANLIKPASDIIQAVPLPTVAQRLGPIAVYPPDIEVTKLMSKIGSVIEVKNNESFLALWSVTALMAPYFAFLASTSEWLIKNNTNKQDASKYIAEMFKSLSILGASIEPADFDSLAKKHQTAGGLNEQAVRELYQDDWYIAIDKTLDRILSRLEGKYVYSPKDS
ncbi:MAG: pyrroline-5-carboxylate reductase [Acidiferrobacteraceae bacterium]|nr:pyrroline-5-carboxylate reductase [Acidiferrobacteraceae bacterium]